VKELMTGKEKQTVLDFDMFFVLGGRREGNE
jgi:hypothetical protein